jgi:phosphoenolpyruvate synthase/pyruvate phosphate dikinase
MGKTAVTGASSFGMEISIEKEELYFKRSISSDQTISKEGGNEIQKRVKLGTNICTLNKGDIITLDGTTGNVYKGVVPTIPAAQDSDYQVLI